MRQLTVLKDFNTETNKHEVLILGESDTGIFYQYFLEPKDVPYTFEEIKIEKDLLEKEMADERQ